MDSLPFHSINRFRIILSLMALLISSALLKSFAKPNTVRGLTGNNSGHTETDLTGTLRGRDRDGRPHPTTRRGDVRTGGGNGSRVVVSVTDVETGRVVLLSGLRPLRKAQRPRGRTGVPDSTRVLSPKPKTPTLRLSWANKTSSCLPYLPLTRTPLLCETTLCTSKSTAIL